MFARVRRLVFFLVLSLAILVVAVPVFAQGEVITVPTYALSEITATGNAWAVSLWPVLVAVAALYFGPKAVRALRRALGAAAR